MFRYFGLLWVLMFGMYFSIAQEIPPIQIFSPQDYGAENQNWAISQSQDKSIYIANNNGLLQYNGARWNLYPTPNSTIMRSVEVIGDRVYTGCYMDFGYWEENDFGRLDYRSLTSELKINLLEDEEIWDIFEFEDHIIFQSLDRIFIYNETDGSLNIMDPKSPIIKMYKVGRDLLFQKMDKGLYKIDGGSFSLIVSGNQINNDEIVNVFSTSNGLLIETREFGFYKFENTTLTKWNIPASQLIEKSSVYNSIRLKDGSFVLGTISEGIIQLSASGDVLLKIDQSTGLSNNTVLSLFEDYDSNIWLGLDNGVNLINFSAPIKFFKDNQGDLGTIYTAKIFEDKLYLGTNQGLFYKSDKDVDFKFVTGTKGQVWSLDLVHDTLFCGHDKGTFVIKEGSAKQITSEKGTWNIKAIPENPNLAIQGNYKGLYILEYTNGNWSLRNNLEGFNISSRYFEFITPYEILVSHEYKGVYKLYINEEYQNLTSFEKLTIPKGKNSSIIRFGDDLLYAIDKGIFKYETETGAFVKDSLLSEMYSPKTFISGKLINDVKGNRLWAFSNDKISFVETENLSGNYKINNIDISKDLRKSIVGYENILYINDNSYLVGNTEGYMILDLKSIQNKSYTINLNSAIYNPLYGTDRPLNLSGEITLKNKENSIVFKYSLADYVAYASTEYQYRLKGIYDTWSNWSLESEVFFENLPHGNYTFEVRGRVGQNQTENIAKYNFTIKEPWFLTPLAITSYFIGFLVLAFLLQYFNRLYFRRKSQKAIAEKERELEYKELENQTQLMEFRNKSLKQDIEGKNRELGISTMNLIKKNEFLNNVKKELQDVKQLKDVNKVIRIIDRDINNKEDWKFFEKAFNNADKDFLKKVKKIHPELTSNDLKLCAYLRLNLASKEIAPLLNISPRSVEVKRYRLRKKMDLPHEASLTDYILQI